MLRLYYTATTMTVIPEDTNNNTEKKSYKKNKKKLVKVLCTKLSIEDYNEFAILTKLAYQDGQIKRPAPSELLRLMIVYLTNMHVETKLQKDLSNIIDVLSFLF
jgi:hypothetical protein